MLVVTTNLTYVDNGIIAEVIVSDMPSSGEDGPSVTPKAVRRVYVEREEAIKFIHEEISRYHPGKGDLAEVVPLKDIRDS